MNQSVELYEKPVAEEICIIAGWEQWADAGSVSTGLPQYLIDLTDARKIGEIKPHGFYLFQVPGTHAFLRPEVKLENGYRRSMSRHANDIYYAGDEQRGLVIFAGTEPHLDAERYASAFYDLVKALGVKRVAVVGGVFGAVPYDKERGVSCVYSQPGMADELAKYAVHFSNYEGGVSIGTYLADGAEREGIELLVFYAFVPAYDLSELSNVLQGIRIENDFKAWHDLMRRLNHMFHLGLDLSDLERRSAELQQSMRDKLDELDRKAPKAGIHEFISKISGDFSEEPFLPLDVWERELGDLFNDTDE